MEQEMERTMTSADFDRRAREAVRDVCFRYYKRKPDVAKMQFVWYAHVLGNKKAILIVPEMQNRMFEVTYNLKDDEMYVDEYEKKTNSAFVVSSEDSEHILF